MGILCTYCKFWHVNCTKLRLAAWLCLDLLRELQHSQDPLANIVGRDGREREGVWEYGEREGARLTEGVERGKEVWEGRREKGR